MSYVVQIVFITLISCALYYVYLFIRLIWKLKINGKAVDQFPMDDKHWLRGHLDKLSNQGEQGLSYFAELVRKYPKACGIYYINFLRPYVMVHHPDTVKVVLKAAGKKPTFFGIYHYAKKWLGDGLLISGGKKWHRNRRLLTPTFHFEALKHYFKIHNQASDIFLENISAFSKSNEPFEMYELASKLSLDIILQCAFSYKSDSQTSKDHFYTKAVNELSKLFIKRQYEPWNHFNFIYWMTSDGKSFLKNAQTVCEFAATLIRERRRMLTKHPDTEYHDFLDILVRAQDADGMGLTDEEVKDEVNTFIFAGYETTSSAISWALYNLAANPGHQKMCQNEIDDLLKGQRDDYLSWENLQDLPYLTKCLKESMRLCGVPYIERELDEDVFIDGKLVPAGSVVAIILHNLHQNPAIWDNPSKFDPERFSYERSKLMDPFAFIPFSAGFRNCIGQVFAMDEVKVVLAKTLRRFSFTVKENHSPLKLMAMTMKSSNGLYLNASERLNRL